MSKDPIWFTRSLFTYWPIAWQGWLLVGGLGLLAGAVVFIAHLVLGLARLPDWRWVDFVVILPIAIWGYWLAEEHTAPRK